MNEQIATLARLDAAPPTILHDDRAESQIGPCVARVVLLCQGCKAGLVFCHATELAVGDDTQASYRCDDCEVAP